MNQGNRLAASAAILGMILLIFGNKDAVEGAREGIDLCLKTVVPALFPFLYLSGVFSDSAQQWQLFRKIHIPGFPPSAAGLIVPAFLGGYPVGAQALSTMYHNRIVSKGNAERMLAYCNNVGPAFLFGIVCSQFGSIRWAFITWGIQLLSIFTASHFFSVDYSITSRGNDLEPANANALERAIQAMLKICGWMILFRVLIVFANRWLTHLLSAPAQVLFIGMLELSNGCCQLSCIQDPHIRFVVCNTMLAFGGLCVVSQTKSVCEGLHLRYYLAGKTVQSMAAFLLSVSVSFGKWMIPIAWCLYLFYGIPREKRSRKMDINAL